MTLKISFNQIAPHTGANNGFGYARKMCEDSLRRLGHEVYFANPESDIEINFIQPDIAVWSGAPYRICYVPWESTKMPEHWLPLMNEVDEVWTPSPVIKEWFINEGVKVPIEIYEHGVEPLWTPQRRVLGEDERVRFLHVGAEALRKGGNMTIDLFMKNFWERNATLVLKMMLEGFKTIDDEHLEIVRESLPIEELVNLYHTSHAMIYPSWGEGFGLNPLQAMATGMPVIITKGWAPYQDLLPERCLIESNLKESPWQDTHPGEMFEPVADDLVEKWVDLLENYQEYADFAYESSSTVAERYDWDTLTKKVFEKFV